MQKNYHYGSRQAYCAPFILTKSSHQLHFEVIDTFIEKASFSENGSTKKLVHFVLLKLVATIEVSKQTRKSQLEKYLTFSNLT